MHEDLEPPRFTVITAARNAASSIAGCIDSVLAQTEKSFEHLIVDDGSTDATAEMVLGATDRRVRIVRTLPEGVSAARNHGLREAHGRWITFLDSDDRALPEWLATWYRLAQPAHTAVVTGMVTLAQSTGNTTSGPCHMVRRSEGAAVAFLPGSYAVRSDVLRAIGGFDEGLQFSEHTDLAFRLADHCEEEGLGWVFETTPVVRISRASPARERLFRYAGMREHAASTLLDRHRDRFAADPKTAADYWRVIAYDRRVLGRRKEAISAASKAWRLMPQSLSTYRTFVGVVVGRSGVGSIRDT